MKAMSANPFAERGRALEDEFFHKHDLQLLGNLRHELLNLEQEHKLSHVSGILDDKVLLDLVRAGVTGESLLAVRMIPMVAVAWSDHIINAQERESILGAAAQDNILPGTAAYELLQSWLKVRPHQEVMAAWHEYVAEMVKVTPPATLRALRERTLRLCQQVAHASDGFWTFGKIPQKTQDVMNEFVSAWEHA